jgi:hypothetical protein
MRSLFCITVAILVCATTPARAQSVWSLEFVGGLNFSQFSGDDTGARVLFADDDLGSGEISGDVGGTRVGLVAGAMVNVFFTDNFGFRSGVLWARKGSDGEVRLRGDIPGLGIVDLTADVSFTLDYFELPLLGVVAFPVSDGATVRMMAGPVLAFNSSADVEVSLFDFSESEDIGDEIKALDVLGLLGLGVVIPVGSVDVVIDGSYSRGFTGIDDTSADLDIKNSEFRVVAGVAIPIGRR